MFSSKPVRSQSKAKTPTNATPRPSSAGLDRRTPPLFARSTLSQEAQGVLSEPGRPLDTTTLRDFGTRFGHDFSGVRVHAGDQAAETAASLSARAYTVGRHVVFGRGEYATGTSTGRRLLGHELAHVVQQSRGGLTAPGANQGLERAADRAADQVARGAPAKVDGASAVGLACQTIFEQFSGGKYMWSVLKGALEHGRPAADLIDDVKHLTPAERDQAIDDMVKERAQRAHDQGFRAGQQSIETDPAKRAVFDPTLAQGQRVLDQIDAVLDGLTPAGYGRKPVPGLNFTPQDFARLQGAKKSLTVAADSGWFPGPLQTNLLNTLAFVLGSTASPSATEGVNAVDFFHGHLVIKKDPATKKQSDAALAEGNKYSADMKKETAKALGNFSAGRGDTVTDKTIAAYKPVMAKMEPALGAVLAKSATVPGAAVMYHTFEFVSPREDKAKGKERKNEDPRRHYVTPVDTNSPQQYTPPAGGYEAEYTHIAKFSFLVDSQGAVHVRTFNTDSSFSTLEVSAISGTALPDTLYWDKPTTAAKKP